MIKKSDLELKDVADLFLEKAPHNIDVTEIKEHIERIDGIIDVHHIHVWSLDMHNNFATMHIVTDEEPHKIKDAIQKRPANIKIWIQLLNKMHNINRRCSWLTNN